MTHLELDNGRKYTKVVRVDEAGHKSALAFIDRETGVGYLAASWTRPNKRTAMKDGASVIAGYLRKQAIGLIR